MGAQEAFEEQNKRAAADSVCDKIGKSTQGAVEIVDLEPFDNLLFGKIKACQVDVGYEMEQDIDFLVVLSVTSTGELLCVQTFGLHSRR